jgi:hypothetical protein
MIPATTKGGSLGDYGCVWIFVFSESDWAKADRLEKFLSLSERGSDESYRKHGMEYAKHIKAEYYYTGLSNDEYGRLGYDDGDIHSPNSEKLF